VRIAEGGLDDPRVQDLIALHQRLAREATAPGFAFALDLSGLRVPEIRFFSAWEDDALLGVGALKRMAPDHGEVKSMHTAQAARRRGVGAALLRHIIGQARAMGMARLSLETGTSGYFAGAIALYLAAGFTPCGPFGDYAASTENRFLTLALG
jgi:putative acetyltransferase